MKCPVCGGLLVWDYERGEVVCSLCGLVFDKITTLEACSYGLTSGGDSGGERRVLMHGYRRVSSSRYKHLLGVYRRIVKLVKNKPWLEVDYEKAFENGRFIYTLKSKASIKALKNVEEQGYWEIVKQGLDYINNVNPAFLARSERSRYALAYMVAFKLKTGRYPSREDVTRVFNISNTSYKRLQDLAEKITTSTTRGLPAPNTQLALN